MFARLLFVSLHTVVPQLSSTLKTQVNAPKRIPNAKRNKVVCYSGGSIFLNIFAPLHSILWNISRSIRLHNRGDDHREHHPIQQFEARQH